MTDFFIESSKTFFALLTAGLIVSWVNYQFLKSERWHKTADSFCVNIEKLITDYFDGNQRQHLAAMKFYAYLESFMIFVDSNQFGKKNPEIYQQLDHLQDFENPELDFENLKLEDREREDKERMMKALTSVAMIRHLFAK